MKKLARIIATSAASMSLMGAVAAADTVAITCGNISNTGPNSTNVVTCKSENNVSVRCENNVVVENHNDQDASSGDASVSGNTNGGFSTTGDATNNNSAVVKIDTACAPAQTVSAPETPTPPTPGRGGGEVAAAPAAAAPAVGRGAGEAAPVSIAALPETGSSALQDAALIGTVVLAGGLVASQLGLSAYRRLALKQ